MISERNINYFCISFLLLFASLSYYLNEPYFVTLAARITIFAIAATGLNLVLGYGNLVSFGHAAFFGVGGYITGILASHHFKSEPIFEWPFFYAGTSNLIIIWLCTIILCAFLAAIIGFFSLRTTGVYFIMITLAFAQMLYYFAISWPSYGGEDGLPIFIRSTIFQINTMDIFNFFIICFFGWS